MGSVNNDWTTIKISEFGKVVTGGTPSTKRPEFFGDIYPFITPTDIDNTRRYIQTSRFLSNTGYKNQESRLLPAGAVCVVCIGATIGKICMTHVPSFTNQQINSVIVDSSKHDEAFVYYLLSTQAEKIKSIAGGAATPIVNKTAFSKIELRVPPLPIQYIIASILSTFDDLIENNTRRIQILEEMTQTIYRQWFMEFKFPGYEDVPGVDSGTELGEIPQGWEIRKLGDIAKVNATSIRKGQAPEQINYVDISSVSTGQIDEIRTVDFEDAPSRARRIVKHGDVIFATVRPNRRSYSLIIHPIANLIVSTGFAVLTPEEVPYTYLYYAVTTDKFVEYLTNRAQGVAYPAINAGDFKGADFIIPPRDLLGKFNMVVQDMVELKHSLVVKNTNLRATRDLLLPQLVNGELDVSKLAISRVE